jgi:hypothetical protein
MSVTKLTFYTFLCGLARYALHSAEIPGIPRRKRTREELGIDEERGEVNG